MCNLLLTLITSMYIIDKLLFLASSEYEGTTNFVRNYRVQLS